MERNLIKTLIDQMEGQVQAGVQQVGVDVIQGYLDRMAASEEAFVQVIDAQMPGLTAKLTALAADPAGPGEALEASLQDVAQLRGGAAGQCDAGHDLLRRITKSLVSRCPAPRATRRHPRASGDRPAGRHPRIDSSVGRARQGRASGHRTGAAGTMTHHWPPLCADMLPIDRMLK